MLRILHTADLHIGMSYNNYPDHIRKSLMQARLDSLDVLVDKANQYQCHMLVIAGDLFHSTRVTKKIMEQVRQKLDNFTGACVAILPGNHDYDDKANGLWDALQEGCSDKILIMNEYQTYSLEIDGQGLVLYPAYCDSQHSEQHRLVWMQDLKNLDPELLHIGVAHGSIEGLSPDFNKKYFPMKWRDMEDIPMDLWLLGHTHISYPEGSLSQSSRIFVPGTPEPDGLDYRGTATAWLLEIDEKKMIQASKVETGQYRFVDQRYPVNSEKDLEAIRQNLGNKLEHTVARIKLHGYMDEDLRHKVSEFEQELRSELYYLLEYNLSDLKMIVDLDLIQRQYTRDGFAQRFLLKLTDDPDALQLAYELIEEARR